jgi:hypothetical protein
VVKRGPYSGFITQMPYNPVTLYRDLRTKRNHYLIKWRGGVKAGVSRALLNKASLSRALVTCALLKVFMNIYKYFN